MGGSAEREAHLQPEAWSDMTPEEMFAVEQVLPAKARAKARDVSVFALARCVGSSDTDSESAVERAADWNTTVSNT